MSELGKKNHDPVSVQTDEPLLTENDLTCLVCCNLFGKRVWQCLDGHNVCNNCFNVLKSTSVYPKCPSCRISFFIATRNLFAEELAQRFRARHGMPADEPVSSTLPVAQDSLAPVQEGPVEYSSQVYRVIRKKTKRLHRVIQKNTRRLYRVIQKNTRRLYGVIRKNTQRVYRVIIGPTMNDPESLRAIRAQLIPQ